MSSESPTNKTKKTPMLFHVDSGASTPIVQALIELGIKDDAVTVQSMSKEEEKGATRPAICAGGRFPAYLDAQGNTLGGAVAIMMRILDDFDTEHKLLPASSDHRRYVCMEAMCLVASLTLVDGAIEDDAVKAIEELLVRHGGSYVLGEQLSCADLFLASVLMGKTLKEPAIVKFMAALEKLPSTGELYTVTAMAVDAKAATETPAETSKDTKDENVDANAETDANPAEEVAAKSDVKGATDSAKAAADTKALEGTAPKEGTATTA